MRDRSCVVRRPVPSRSPHLVSLSVCLDRGWPLALEALLRAGGNLYTKLSPEYDYEPRARPEAFISRSQALNAFAELCLWLDELWYVVMYVRLCVCPVEFSGREPSVQLFVTASYEDIITCTHSTHHTASTSHNAHAPFRFGSS